MRLAKNRAENLVHREKKGKKEKGNLVSTLNLIVTESLRNVIIDSRNASCFVSAVKKARTSPSDIGGVSKLLVGFGKTTALICLTPLATIRRRMQKEKKGTQLHPSRIAKLLPLGPDSGFDEIQYPDMTRNLKKIMLNMRI